MADELRQEQVLILALAGGQSVVRAARLSGISERTIYRRLQEPEFRERVSAARSQLVENAAAGLSCAMNQAVIALKHLLTADSESVRLGAARSVLDFGLRLREHDEFDRRLQALERQNKELEANAT